MGRFDDDIFDFGAFLSGQEAPEEADEQLADAERRILRAAITRHNGNRAAAGRELGVSSRMMNYKLGKLGMLSVGRESRSPGGHGALPFPS